MDASSTEAKPSSDDGVGGGVGEGVGLGVGLGLGEGVGVGLGSGTGGVAEPGVTDTDRAPSEPLPPPQPLSMSAAVAAVATARLIDGTDPSSRRRGAASPPRPTRTRIPAIMSPSPNRYRAASARRLPILDMTWTEDAAKRFAIDGGSIGFGG